MTKPIASDTIRINGVLYTKADLEALKEAGEKKTAKKGRRHAA